MPHYSSAPIFRDYDRDEEAEKTKEKETGVTEKYRLNPVVEIVTKPTLKPEEKMSYWNCNMEHVYFLERRFRIDISVEDSFDMVKEKLCKVKTLNDTEEHFIKKLQLCKTFEELFTIWNWFITLYD